MTKGQKFFQFCLSHGLFEPMALPRWNTLTEVFFTGLSPSTACARGGQDGLSRSSLASGGDARRTRLDAGPGQGRGKARRGEAMRQAGAGRSSPAAALQGAAPRRQGAPPPRPSGRCGAARPGAPRARRGQAGRKKWQKHRLAPQPLGQPQGDLPHRRRAAGRRGSQPIRSRPIISNAIFIPPLLRSDQNSC